MISFTSLLEKLADSYHDKMPFVGYNKPNSTKIHAILQKDDSLHYVKNYKEQGFVFAPFDSEKPTIIIPNDISFSSRIDLDTNFIEKNKESDLELEEVKIAHVSLVKKTIDFIEASDVSKIVVARSKSVQVESFDPFETFKKLVYKYKHATCYIWFHPKVGLWMGASPETLLEIESPRFDTMSLAGTQRYVDTIDVSWGKKELEEQQMVTDYVLSNLQPVTTNLDNTGTYTFKAGGLLHLRTDIQGIVSDNYGVSGLINVLHPTPAVCGFPRKASKKFILDNENFERSYYTGFFGELNIHKKSSFYVNLRCMEKTDPTTICLYVGGGITAKSDPVKEWEETVAKCKTMESIL